MIPKTRHGQQNQVSTDRSACVGRIPHRLARATVLLYGRFDVYSGDRGKNVRSAGMLDK